MATPILSSSADEHEHYLKERFWPQVKWYDQRATFNQKRYVWFHWALLSLAALTPILVALHMLQAAGVNTPRSKALDWLPLVTSIAVTFIAGALKTFNYQEYWLSYRSTCEQLQREYYLYKAGVGSYKDGDDRTHAIFVNKVESIMAGEHDRWFEVANKPQELKGG